MLGDAGALAAMAPGALFVDHTTVSPAIARRIADEAERRGVLALDAPVSGGQAGAENGKLSIMCGGSVEAMDGRARRAARPMRRGSSMSARPGRAKQPNRSTRFASPERSPGCPRASASPRPPGSISTGCSKPSRAARRSRWQMDNRWKTMTEGEFDFGFAIDWMRKDLAIALAEARGARRCELPVDRAGRPVLCRSPGAWAAAARTPAR